MKLNLTLRSSKPSTVYSTNGKSYRLQPGKNTLDLPYDDYIALTKALSINPKKIKNNEPEKQAESVATVEQPVESVSDVVENESKSELEDKQVSETVKEEPTIENEDELVEENKSDEQIDDVASEVNNAESDTESQLEEDNHELIEESKQTETTDYENMTVVELKAMYKEITGKTCKLKKAEIIEFLMENKKDA